MLLHPPPLAVEFSASYGEMSRRSGFAAKADNHSDISPFDSLRSLRASRAEWNQQFTATGGSELELFVASALGFTRERRPRMRRRDRIRGIGPVHAR